MVKIALVGRPNVGKSALFNRICKKRVAIVEDIEGVTRDRLTRDISFEGIDFTLIDTGGIDFAKTIPYHQTILEQAEFAVSEADCIIMVVDAITGVQQEDQMVARKILSSNKKVIVAVNKADDHTKDHLIHDFYTLGVSHLFAVSCLHNRGIFELLDEALSGVEKSVDEEPGSDELKVCIVGRSNVGKSTFINAVLGQKRLIVQDEIGTTRDSIEIKIDVDAKPVTLVDTAGMRKVKSQADCIEKFSWMRAKKAIEESSICIMLIDAYEGLTSMEKTLLTYIETKGSGCILFCNKWDLVKDVCQQKYRQRLIEQNSFVEYIPIIFGSALNSQNVSSALDHIFVVQESLAKSITTGRLNQFMQKTIEKLHPPVMFNKRLKIYYLVQTNTFAPTFSLFINHAKLMSASYHRYLINQMRKEFGFTGAPIKFHLKDKKVKGQEQKASVLYA
jgi:GTPase